MRKKLRAILVSFVVCLVSTLALGAASSHLMKLKSRFPYGLIGDDHGVLSVNDLALNACHIKPTPFVPGAIHPYEYWECFESKFISAACENIEPIEEEGVVGWVIVRIKTAKETHEFFRRRPVAVRDCRSFVKDLKKLMKGTSHACISANYIKEETDKSGKKASIGILTRFKTRKGCDGEECELTATFKRENCPDLYY